MSLQGRIGDLITAIATDVKQLRTWITGSSSGSLASLATTVKTDLVSAVNEVHGIAVGGSGSPATETDLGSARIATLAEVTTGTSHSYRFVTPAGVRQERNALKAELLGGATAAFDTLQELATLIADAEESSVISALTTTVGNKADTSSIYTRTELGDPETDLVAAYTAAKA